MGYALRGPGGLSRCSQRQGLGGRKKEHTVGVEDARDADLDAVLAMVPVRQRFSDPLALVVARTRTDRVDVAPTRERRSQNRSVTRKRGDVGGGECTY